MGSPQLTSPEEFRMVMDRIFGMMSTDEEMGPRLELLPMTRPVFARYTELVRREYPHLAA